MTEGGGESGLYEINKKPLGKTNTGLSMEPTEQRDIVSEHHSKCLQHNISRAPKQGLIRSPPLKPGLVCITTRKEITKFTDSAFLTLVFHVKRMKVYYYLQQILSIILRILHNFKVDRVNKDIRTVVKKSKSASTLKWLW